MMQRDKKINSFSDRSVGLLYEIAHGAYLKNIVIGVIILLCVGTGIGGYALWSRVQARHAQRALAECMHEFYQAQSGAVEWENVSRLCAQAYEKYKRTALRTVFLSLQAHAYARRKNFAQAVEVMQQALDQLLYSDQYRPLYEVKKALISLDYARQLGDAAMTQAALKTLEQIAQGQANVHGADEAAYELGNYYWMNGEVENARAAWKTLERFKGKNSQGDSPYLMLVNAKMQKGTA